MRKRPATGVESVLFVAARDETFRAAVLRDPEAAASARGIVLQPSEVEMLRRIPPDQLQATIDGVDASPENVQRRRFMQVVAAGAVGAAAAKSLSGCGDDDGKPGVDAGPDIPAATGSRPDWPDAGGDARRDNMPMAGVRAPDGWRDGPAAEDGGGGDGGE